MKKWRTVILPVFGLLCGVVLFLGCDSSGTGGSGSGPDDAGTDGEVGGAGDYECQVICQDANGMEFPGDIREEDFSAESGDAAASQCREVASADDCNGGTPLRCSCSET